MTPRKSRVPRDPHPERFLLEPYLLIVGDQRVHGGHMDRQEAMDAMYECRHGRLSHDSSPACGCWRGELAPVIALPVDGLGRVAA